MSINNRPRTIAAVLRACELMITDHEHAMAEFLQKGGLEVRAATPTVPLRICVLLRYPRETA